MSGKNDGHFTVGDALTALVVGLFINPVGWSIVIFTMVMVYKCSGVS